MAATETQYRVSKSKFTHLIQEMRVRPDAVALFTLAFAYRSGLWLVVIHQIEGATERGEPPLILHWLRDSTLMLPLVLIAVLISLAAARWTIQRINPNTNLVSKSLIAVAFLAVITSAAMAAGSPLHDVFFQSSEPQFHSHSAVGADVSFAHIAYDGFLALGANLIIAALVMVILDGRVWREDLQIFSPVSNKQ